MAVRRFLDSVRTFRAVAVLAVCVAVGGCIRVLQRPADTPTELAIAELWREPTDIAARDLFYGAGGSELQPRPVTYAFIAEKTTGTNPGYDVRDPDGRVWSVKLGEEAQSEVTVSRVLWAVGFHQPPVYFVDGWRLSGGDAPAQPAARFRRELEEQPVVDDWSWYDNPFIGSRPFAALITVNVLLRNWDLKASNNKIYEVVDADGLRERRYVVRDLGASLGLARQHWFWHLFGVIRHQQGSKNSLADFQKEGFVRRVDGDRVEFYYRGVADQLVESVTTADLRWTCALLSRLSERQWLDAFRAGGYTQDERAAYVRIIRERIREAEQLAGAASE